MNGDCAVAMTPDGLLFALGNPTAYKYVHENNIDVIRNVGRVTVFHRQYSSCNTIQSTFDPDLPTECDSKKYGPTDPNCLLNDPTRPICEDGMCIHCYDILYDDPSTVCAEIDDAANLANFDMKEQSLSDQMHPDTKRKETVGDACPIAGKLIIRLL